MARKIGTFEPDLPVHHWAVIGDFVREAVTDCDLKTTYSATELMSACTKHVHWCWQTAALPLDRDVIFSRDVIAEYIDRGFDATPAYRGNIRSKLLRMSELLLGPGLATTRLTPLPAGKPSAPYTTAETTLLRAWAAGQNTENRRVSAHVLLALSMGAGLSGGEVIAARCGDITVDDQGVLVEVTGPRARIVPVIGEWEPTLIAMSQAAIRPDMFVFKPTRKVADSQSLVYNFVARTPVQAQVWPTTQRMRATWIVRHLTAGTPVKWLTEAAGVESLEAFTRYLQYIPGTSLEEARAAFRLNAATEVDE